MRLRTLPLIGLALLFWSQSIHAESLYDLVREDVATDLDLTSTEKDITNFIHEVIKQKLMEKGVAASEAENMSPTTEDIDAILKDEWTGVCARMKEKDVEEYGNVFGCQLLVDQVKRIASDEERIRMLGRSLQSAATSYELTVSDLPSRTMQFANDLHGIVSIWTAGKGAVQSSVNGPLSRFVAIDEDAFRPLLQNVGDVLTQMQSDIGPEQPTAAIWRYQYGVRFVREDRTPRFPAPYIDGESGPGTERQYLFKRWNTGSYDLESPMLELWDAVVDLLNDPDVFKTPLEKEETAYLLFPLSLLHETLPKNVILWARIDGNQDGNFPMGDVGLQWEVPLDPVMPSLVAEGGGPILGGRYPPNPERDENGKTIPVDGRGLCSMPAGQRGYLCRMYVPLQIGDHCPVPENTSADAITLLSCKSYEDKLDTTGVWCCTGGAGKCRYKLTNEECEDGGGIPRLSPLGCEELGCEIPKLDPVWCCLPNQGRQCTQKINEDECTLEGGTPLDDPESCVDHGCRAPTEEQRTTPASSDVCRETDYKIQKSAGAIDTEYACKLRIICAESCDSDYGAPSKTKLKEGDGTIVICINNETALPATYWLHHELAHAHFLCGQPPEWTPFKEVPAGASPEERKNIELQNNAACCEAEGAAYRAQCERMERDGAFKNEVIDGIPLTAESCAEAFVNLAPFGCKAQGMGECYVSRKYPADFIARLENIGASNPADVPTTCSELIVKQNGKTVATDPRVRDFIEEIESDPFACTPGRLSKYENRIGNNACFLGQCVEQSIELHRTMGANTPSVVQEPYAAWDDPLSGTPLGNIVLNAPLQQARLPLYRPGLLIQTMETALCQSQGLPPLTPPILCAIRAARQLSYQQLTPFSTTIGMTEETGEQLLTEDDLLRVTPAVGARIGTNLFSTYLTETTRSFADLLTTAAQLLEELKKLRFPVDMCPVGPGLPAPLPQPSSSSAP